MIKLELSSEQFNYLFKLLDNELRTNGLQALAPAVDLHNVLAKKVQELQTQGTRINGQKPEPGGDSPPTPHEGV